VVLVGLGIVEDGVNQAFSARDGERADAFDSEIGHGPNLPATSN
jgi:hypothetical protein